MKKNNPFKEIEESQAIPRSLKRRVMTSIKKAQLLINITDLFTIKVGKTLRDLFITENKK